MKIGYTVIEENVNYLKEACDKVIYVAKKNQHSHEFIEFVTGNMENELFTYSVGDIGLQLVQMVPAFEALAKKKKVISFIDKECSERLSDEAYNHLLLTLGKREKSLIVARTMQGMSLAKQNGKSVGRPKINPKTITKIRRLHHDEKKTVREIALICGVSIGTAHKYAIDFS